MAKLDAARDRVALLTGQRPKVTLCYHASLVPRGYEPG